MADPNNGQLVSTAFENVISNKPVDQYFKEFWMLKYLTEKNGGLKTVDGGRTIVTPVSSFTSWAYICFNERYTTRRGRSAVPLTFRRTRTCRR